MLQFKNLKYYSQFYGRVIKICVYFGMKYILKKNYYVNLFINLNKYEKIFMKYI